ncbi:hypothetical protein ABMY26_07385 (plasmid) [Azospirillum sp. HJ39]|uniref:hypothetical protein n=1 Tax=Azospirillum sp. HJ39 TaxID=3159496 RepID=UPI003558B053
MAAIGLLLILIALSILGERTLALFGGDRILAARFYKTLYVALGAGMLSCALPALVTGFATQLRALIVRARTSGMWTDALLSDRMLEQAHTVSLVLAFLTAVAGVVAAVLVWCGIMWPSEP